MEDTVNRIFDAELTQKFVSGLYERFLKGLREWLVSYLLYKHKNLILEFQNFHKIRMCFHATVAINRYSPKAWSLESVARMLRYWFREKFCLKGLHDKVFEKIISAPTSDLQMTSLPSQVKINTHPHNYTHTYTFTVEYTHEDKPSQVRNKIHTHKHRDISSQVNIHIKTHIIHTQRKIIFHDVQNY